MKLHRCLIMLVVFMVGLGVAMAAERAVNPALQQPVKIIKVPLSKQVLVNATATLKGAIKLKSAPPSQLAGMTCYDINLSLGKYITNPPPNPVPPGYINIPTFEEVSAVSGVGDFTKGTCTYKFAGVPTGTPYSVLVSVTPKKFRCDVVGLGNASSWQNITFEKGKTVIHDFDLTPTCQYIK